MYKMYKSRHYPLLFQRLAGRSGGLCSRFTIGNEAFRYAESIHTKKELIETALKEFVRTKRMKDLRELKGKIQFTDDYDYKKMRERQ
jgi:hypothetical protein